jgi:ankyrin repeat protein
MATRPHRRTSAPRLAGDVVPSRRSNAPEPPPHPVRVASRPTVPETLAPRAAMTLVHPSRSLNRPIWKSRFIEAARRNARNSRGDTALLFSIRRHGPALVSFLLDAGLDVDNVLNQKDRAGRTPIELAFQLGHVGIARQLLEWRAHVAGMQGLPLTFYCAAWARPDFLHQLLNHGAEVDATDENGRTLLIAAAANNDLNVIAVLMQNGANALATTPDGVNAAITAAANGHLSALQVFIGDLHVPIDATTSSGLTAVLIAAKRGHARVVKYLLARGADIHALTHTGQDIIMLAATSGHLEVLRYVIEKRGIPVNTTTDKSGLTALHLAASKGHLQIVDYLLAQGGIAGATTDDGESVAVIAARNGQLKVLEFLKSREPEADPRLAAMRPADFMALVQSTPGPRDSPIKANRLAPLSQEQRLFDAMLTEIEAQRPVTAGRFNAWLARARLAHWSTAAGLTRFLKALEVLAVCLRALPAHDAGTTRGKRLDDTACAILAITGFDRYCFALRKLKNQPGIEWSSSGEFGAHVEDHMKRGATTRAFLWTLQADNVRDRMGLKKVLYAETGADRGKLHRTSGHKLLVAEYRQARLAAMGADGMQHAADG